MPWATARNRLAEGSFPVAACKRTPATATETAAELPRPMDMGRVLYSERWTAGRPQASAAKEKASSSC